MPRKPRFTDRARAFWQQRQSRAQTPGYSGYLLDESPPSLGQRRFEGEWADLQGFLQRSGPGRTRCLDLGCGSGLWMQALAGLFAQVEGWDYAPAMARAARERLSAAGLRNTLVRCGDLRRRKGRAVFDFIFVGGVLMYTPPAELPSLLASLRRLLKPGGRLLLRESCTQGAAWQREGQLLRVGLLAQAADPADYVAVYRSRQQLRQALATAGLALIEEKANAHYKLSDLSEDWLRRLDRLGFKMQGQPQRAERAAHLIHRLRWLLLYPEYKLRRWQLENRWFFCAQAARR